jgi:hypothetical protein
MLVEAVANPHFGKNWQKVLTEEEWVQCNKAYSDEHACVLKECHEEARENAKQDQLLKNSS